MDKLTNLYNTDWFPFLNSAINQENYFQDLLDFLVKEYNNPNQKVYPPRGMVFNAYQTTALAQTKVVLVGQDPYHQPGQAIGLSFAVPNQVPAPPSLVNIIKELEADLKILVNGHDLTKWAKQGILLLNSSLTVVDSRPNSHANLIWETLTDSTIKVASDHPSPKVFILWGKFAQGKRGLIDSSKHLIIESAHPSPLSAHRGFFGSKPFSTTNQFLIKHKLDPINWIL